MKKVIKHGNTHFKTTCPYCGCEFEYDSEDLEERNCWPLASTSLINSYKIVKCPDCGAEIYHSNLDYQQYPKVYYNTNTGLDTNTGLADWPDCATCPNRPDPDHPVIGDTPCTWCKKNQVTCDTSTNKVDTSMKNTFIRDTMTGKVFDNCCKSLDEEKDWIRCPYCGECYYQEGYTTSTLMWCPTTIKDGKVISEDLNTSTTRCHCLTCGKDFTYDNKGNINKCEQLGESTGLQIDRNGFIYAADDNNHSVEELKKKEYTIHGVTKK